MAPNNPLPTQHGWDSGSESELSDSPSLEEFADTERSMQFPSTPRRSVRPANMAPKKRPRLHIGAYQESDSSPTRAPRKRKQSRPTKSSKTQKEHLESDEDGSEDESDEKPTPPPRFEPGTSPTQRQAFEKESLRAENLAPIQRLPGEILDPIALSLGSDVDLANLRLVDRHFLESVSPGNNIIWRNRFLSRWDAPFITEIYQFCPAYKERIYVISRPISFANGDDPRVEVHLRTFQEMVLESFHPLQPYLPPPAVSLNLIVFTSANDWIRSLLSSPFYNHGREVYGKPEPLFDALQLSFSFLLLSPKYPVAKVIVFRRADYDIAKVYNWDVPFKTLFTRLPAPKPQKLFPNLNRPEASVVKFALDTNELLHIRNFFHHHMIHDTMGAGYMGEIPEDTFYRSSNKLVELGHIPKAWTAPLQNPDANLDGILYGKWVGFYSSVGVWPEKKRDLVELQTDATDWTEVDPLTLDFSVSTSNTQGSAVIWPDTFANIPCFASTVPTSPQETAQLRNAGLGSTFFLRGMAPFMNIDAAVLAHRHGADRVDNEGRSNKGKGKGRKDSATPQPGASLRPTSSANDTDAKAPPPKLSKHHPYNGLRLRGVIHPLPAEFDLPTSEDKKEKTLPVPMALEPALPIPGFHRVVLVLYKPSISDLLKQLEYADESYGSTFGVAVSAQMDQATIAAIQTVVANGGELPQEALEHMKSYLAGLILQREAQGEDEGEAENNGDEAKGKPAKVKAKAKWTKEEIGDLERGFHKDGQIDWADVEYAYAYEGVVCPGGNVMMGRWWRVGMAGEGVSAGCEIDSLGFGVPDGSAEAEAGGVGGADDTMDWEATGGNAAGGGSGAAPRATVKKALERGPFVFWPMAN